MAAVYVQLTKRQVRTLSLISANSLQLCYLRRKPMSPSNPTRPP